MSAKFNLNPKMSAIHLRYICTPPAQKHTSAVYNPTGYWVLLPDLANIFFFFAAAVRVFFAAAVMRYIRICANTCT